MIKVILSIVCVVVIFSYGRSQNYHPASVDSAFNVFINDTETAKWLLDGLESANHTVYFIDMFNQIKRPSDIKWKGYKVEFYRNKSTLDSLMKWEPHFVFQTRREYYVVQIEKVSSGKFDMHIHHAYNNAAAQATVVFKGNAFTITNRVRHAY